MNAQINASCLVYDRSIIDLGRLRALISKKIEKLDRCGVKSIIYVMMNKKKHDIIRYFIKRPNTA